MKKLLSVVLALAIVVCAVPFGTFTFTASAATEGTEGYYTYTVENDEATITGVDTSISGVIIIPSTLGGYPVINIGDSAFFNCSSLTSITIPDSVTSIGNDVFDNCSSLTSITIPDSVTSIGEGAFSCCTTLESVTIPEGVTSIGDYAFSSCTSLTSITIPDSVTSIGQQAFYNCTSLTSITIPDSVTSIGVRAFYNCTRLTSVTIPNSVKNIGELVFLGCNNLQSVTVSENNEYFCSIDGVLFNNDKSSILCYPAGKTAQSFDFPNSVTSIGDGAFNNCTSLTSITIPDSVTSIGVRAFYYCTSLTNITIPDSVTSIGQQAFYKCTSLTNITIPDSVTSIGNYAFDYCTNLTAVFITDISAWCEIDFSNSSSTPLYYAKNLYLNDELVTNLVIPNGVTSIGNYAFSGCTSLTSVSLGNSVTSIGASAFLRCTSLESVYYKGSETDKEKISIGTGNDYLTNATWYYNSCIGAETHDYADATCETSKTCKVCGATSGDALGHSYDNACDTVCNTCGETRTITHDYADAICTAPKTCKVCGVTSGDTLGHSYDNACDNVCNTCGEIRDIAHDYADATCETAKTCKVCGATSGSKLAHNLDNGTVTKKTTCTATGTKTYKCTLCKATLKTENIAKVAHKYDAGKVTKKATCKVTGVKTYTCSVCKDTKTAKIAKVAHSYASATCTKAKTCKVCGVTSGKALGHTYTTTTTKATLSKNGKTVKKCTVCGKVASTTTIKYAKSFILSTTSYTYNGKVKTPSVTVKDSAGKTLKKNTDYTVTYASGRKNVGTYKVTIKMKGNYSGTKTLTFKINPASTKVSKLTAGKKSITVNISKKSTQVTGYQVQYSTSKSFSSTTTKTISSYKTTKVALKSLSAKKTYYVRVRTYKTVNGKKYYSAWSTAKSVKTK